MPPFNPMRYPRRGDPTTAALQREMIREVRAARNLEMDGPVSFDSTGSAVRFDIQYPPKLQLMEITGDWETHSPCSGSSSSSSSSSGAGDVVFPDGVCRATAIPVLYFSGDQGWAQEHEGREVYIFHPAGYPPEERDDLIDAKVFIPRFSVGAQVWCLFNQQSGWWEIISGGEEFWRFKLTSSLTAGGTATACLRISCHDCGWESVDAITFTVCDSMEMFAGGVGSRGIAKWFSRYDGGQWEIIQMECP